MLNRFVPLVSLLICCFLFFNLQLIFIESDQRDFNSFHLNPEAQISEESKESISLQPKDKINGVMKDVITFTNSKLFSQTLMDTATLAIIGNIKKKTIKITSRSALQLSKYFEDLSLETVDAEDLCGKTKTPGCQEWTQVTAESYLNNNESSEGITILRDSLPSLVLENIDIVKNIFTSNLRKDAVNTVQKYFQSLKKKLKSDDVTFVSINVNRNINTKNLVRPVDELFFHFCLGEFLKKYPDSVFIVISDNILWSRQHLKHERIMFPDMKSNIAKDVLDLTLLTQVNHSIYDYGGLGFWGAVMAGGETMLADKYYNPSDPTFRDDILTALQHNTPADWNLVDVTDIYLLPWLNML